MITLFNDQVTSVAGLRASIARGHKAPLLVSPTGSGKTVIFSYLTWKLCSNGKRVAILAHREELVDQISTSLHRFTVPHGIVAAGMPYDKRPLAHVNSVATLARRLDRVEVPDYVIIDEAHHAILDSMWGRVIAHWRLLNPALKVIGVTATPERLSGEGLGQVFDDMVMGPSTAELIANGRLSPYKLYAPPTAQQVDLSSLRSRGGDYAKDDVAGAMDKPAIIGSAVSHYRQHCNGAPAIAFCASIAHAAHVAEQFQNEGFRAQSIDGSMDKTTRRNIVRDFGNGQISVMTSCDLVSEGFDCPGIVGAILLRPTQSLALNLQQVGRALRVAPGKSHAVILDHVGNSSRHGLPDDEREWTLEGRERKKGSKRDPDDVAIRQCKACYAISRATASACRECGKAFEVNARTVDEREGTLAEVDPALMRAQQIKAQASARTVDDMVATLGYSAGRAQHILEAREEKARLQDEVFTLSAHASELGHGDALSIHFIRALKPKMLRQLRDELAALVNPENEEQAA